MSLGADQIEDVEVRDRHRNRRGRIVGTVGGLRGDHVEYGVRFGHQRDHDGGGGGGDCERNRGHSVNDGGHNDNDGGHYYNDRADDDHYGGHYYYYDGCA